MSEEELAAVADKLGPLTFAGEWTAWPEWAPKRFNACTDPCDMFDGPCACGAWHKRGR